MSDTARQRRLDKAQMKVLFQVPFFAPGVCKLPVVWDDSIPTACTDGDRIKWGREHFDKCGDQELVTVLCHEVAHCLLGHIWRIPGGGDWGVWNEATDHAVNGMLKQFSDLVTAKGLAAPFPMPEGALCNTGFSGMSEEQVYKALQNRPKGNQGDQSGKPGKGAKAGNKTSPGQSLGEIQASPKSNGAGKAKKTEWQATLVQSVEAMKGRGDVPGDIVRLVHDMLNPVVPWQDLLRSLLREQCADDWSWSKPNRLYDDGEFILPVLDNERMSAVVFGIDTSGSVNQELLKAFKSEMQGCLDDLKPAKLVEFCCDTRVTSEVEYQVGDRIKEEAPGGGGTELGKIFERIGERGDNPKAVVVLTDLYTPFPKEVPPYPVIWCKWGACDVKPPFGEVVHVA